MKDTLIVETKLKAPWGGIFKGEEFEEQNGCGGETLCLDEVADMLGNVTRTSGRILAA